MFGWLVDHRRLLLGSFRQCEFKNSTNLVIFVSAITVTVSYPNLTAQHTVLYGLVSSERENRERCRARDHMLQRAREPHPWCFACVWGGCDGCHTRTAEHARGMKAICVCGHTSAFSLFFCHPPKSAHLLDVLIQNLNGREFWVDEVGYFPRSLSHDGACSVGLHGCTVSEAGARCVSNSASRSPLDVNHQQCNCNR